MDDLTMDNHPNYLPTNHSTDMTGFSHPNYTNANGTAPSPDDGHSLGSTDIAAICMYVIIGTFGIIGNTLVMIVFGLLTKKKSQVNMFIFNQALIDGCTAVLLILFGVINAFRPSIMMYEYDSDVDNNSTSGHFMYISTPMAEFLCRFWWSRFFLFSCFAISTWNLTVMSIERYFAVLHPTTYSRNFSKRHAIIMMVVIWMVAPIMQYVPAIFQYIPDPTAFGMCGFQDTWTNAAGAALGTILFIWEFILPVTIMAYVYYMIFRELKKKKLALRRKKQVIDPPSATGTPTKLPSRGASKVVHPSRNITMTLCILFGVYVICWTPNQFTFLQFNYGGYLDFTGTWYQFTVAMAFLNCCVNPFIYALRLQKFKKGMRMLIAGQRSRKMYEHKGRNLNESTSFNGLDADSMASRDTRHSVLINNQVNICT